LDELTSEQLSEWEAMDRIDPIGSWRDDFRMSYIASLITNLFIRTHGRRGAKLTEVKDFILDWDKGFGRKAQSMEEMKQVLLSLANRKFPVVKSRKNLQNKGMKPVKNKKQ